MTAPRPSKWTARLVIAGAVVVVGAIAATVYFTGALIRWEGSYSGIVRVSDLGLGGTDTERVSGSPGGITVMKDPARDGTTLVLTAPDLKNGSCAVVLQRRGRGMEAHDDQHCPGVRRDYVLATAWMTADGDNLSVKLLFDEPGHDGSSVRVHFIGARTISSGPTLPPLFPVETKEEAAKKDAALKEQQKACWDRYHKSESDCGDGAAPPPPWSPEAKGKAYEAKVAAFNERPKCLERNERLLDECLRDAGAPAVTRE